MTEIVRATTKSQLLETIEQEWAQLQSALNGLDEEQMLLPGVVGEWSLKDVLAHIAVWQSHLVTAMFRAEKGFKPQVFDSEAEVDRFNRQNYLEQQTRTFEQIWDDLDSSYRQLLKRLDNWSEAMLFEAQRFKWMQGQPFVRFVEGDSSEHYAEHAEDIRAWRQRQGI
jgi:hypothetical protein